MKFKQLGCFLLFLFLCQIGDAKEPLAVYTTFKHDPSHTMLVCWVENKGGEKSFKFRQQGTECWQETKVLPLRPPERSAYFLFCLELLELQPESTYEFCIEENHYFVRTLPTTLTRPIKWVVGGDIYHHSLEIVHNMNLVAATLNPDFAVLGGDISYAAGRHSFIRESVDRWVDFLHTWTITMVRKDGTLIPLISTIGNHDTNGRFEQYPEKAKWYYYFFPQDDRGYRSFTIGNCAELLLLDSGHTHPVTGEQKAWLETTLKTNQDKKYRFAVYHVPAYPSVRPMNNEYCTAIRKNWSPIFEKYRLTAAFEHHDHTYKRTHPILAESVHPQGVVYFGDGAWGVSKPRQPAIANRTWYLAQTKPFRHIILITLNDTHTQFEAVNEQGQVFDSYTR